MSLNRNDTPTPRKAAGQFAIHEELSPLDSEGVGSTKSITKDEKPNIVPNYSESTVPLQTSRLANLRGGHESLSTNSASSSRPTTLLLPPTLEPSPIDKLLASLSQQKGGGDKGSKNSVKSDKIGTAHDEPRFSSQGSKSLSADSANATVLKSDPFEVRRLREELEAAKNQISAMDQELSQQRITSQSVDSLLSSPSETKYRLEDVIRQSKNKPPNSSAFPALTRYSMESQAERAVTSSPSGFDPFQAQWDDGRPGQLPLIHPTGLSGPVSAWNSSTSAPWSGYDPRATANHARYPNAAPFGRTNYGRPEGFENNHAYRLNNVGAAVDPWHRQNIGPHYPSLSTGASFTNNVNSFPASAASSPLEISPSVTPMHVPPMGNAMHHGPMPYQPRPIGTPLSPTALEFSAANLANNSLQSANWNNQPIYSDTSSSYAPPSEPMNYRRLLDRNVSCNWKYIVDKIVCNNDQQASIFLQQKLKVSTSELKYEIVEAIIAQAYPLMINRFGNFLVQRCFEHGTPEQVLAIANSIRGNTLNLSMDAFGCHVVQKAFDVVPEDFKAVMVHELLRRIPETVIHRYACHVWQKLFELRWSGSPPQIMKYVNEALRGMWHEVALGETGSLVVQNIFENCLEEDKRPCINEVLASIDIVAHGQFGNWCIQHICEHGLPADKSRAVEHVLRYSTEYSTDQFASKVVEKCLKVGGNEFLERYLDRVCEGRPDRPRMPLIDIAGDQYGNYLIQYILINANPHHREIVSNHVRKHMVSLRGSKFGSRVAMLCSNPAHATRPGPPVGLHMNNRYMQNMGMPRGPVAPQYR